VLLSMFDTLFQASPLPASVHLAAMFPARNPDGGVAVHAVRVMDGEM